MTDVLLTLLSSIVKTRPLSKSRSLPSITKSTSSDAQPPTDPDSGLRTESSGLGAHLARLALGSRFRQTRHRRRMASQGFPFVLDLEESAQGSRETLGGERHPRSDSRHEQSQSSLGCSTDS